MNLRRLALYLLPIPILAALAFFLIGRQLPEDAPLPEAPRQVLPSAQFANPAATVAYYEERLRRTPDDDGAFAPLAQAHLQLASETGRETEHVPAAQRAIEEGLRRMPDDYHLLLLKGTLLNKLHRFEEARDLAEGAIARHPRHAYAYGVLVDALVELGEYDRAVMALDTMLAIKPGIPSYSRAAYLRELHGDGDGAIAAMRMAADAGLAGTPDRSWALYQLGLLYLNEAKPDTAAFLFRGLLQERPDYPYAVAGLGQVALATGAYDDAIERFETAYVMAPHGAFRELLAEAHAAAGHDAEAEEALRGVRADLAAAREMGEIVEMEEADFMLDNGIQPNKALVMAKRQVERRPDHLHAQETYAWALHHTGRSAEAIPVIERVIAFGAGDAMVHHRAAQIYQGAGRPADAARHARLAIENRLRVESPSAADEAERMLASMESGTPIQTASTSR